MVVPLPTGNQLTRLDLSIVLRIARDVFTEKKYTYRAIQSNPLDRATPAVSFLIEKNSELALTSADRK